MDPDRISPGGDRIGTSSYFNTSAAKLWITIAFMQRPSLCLMNIAPSLPRMNCKSMRGARSAHRRGHRAPHLSLARSELNSRVFSSSRAHSMTMSCTSIDSDFRAAPDPLSAFSTSVAISRQEARCRLLPDHAALSRHVPLVRQVQQRPASDARLQRARRAPPLDLPNTETTFASSRPALPNVDYARASSGADRRHEDKEITLKMGSASASSSGRAVARSRLPNSIHCTTAYDIFATRRRARQADFMGSR